MIRGNSVALSQQPFSPPQPSPFLFLQLSSFSLIPVVLSLILRLASSSLQFLHTAVFWTPFLASASLLFFSLSFSSIIASDSALVNTLVPKFDLLGLTLLFVVLWIFPIVVRNSEIAALIHRRGDFGLEDIGTPCVSTKADEGFAVLVGVLQF